MRSTAATASMAKRASVPTGFILLGNDLGRNTSSASPTRRPANLTGARVWVRATVAAFADYDPRATETRAAR
jgi:hypothetical protein